MRIGRSKAKKIITRQNLWSNLSDDIICLIISRLNFVDKVRFQAVCKSWRRANLHGVNYADKLPWIMAYNSRSCFLYNPSHNRKYTISNLSLENRLEYFNATALESKYGWVLFMESVSDIYRRYYTYQITFTRIRNSFFFYNPFTDETIELPKLYTEVDVQAYSRGKAATFSSIPTSSDCVVFLLCAYSDKYCINVCKLGDENWTTLSFHDCHGWIQDVEYVEGDFYCCFSHRRRGAMIGVYKVSLKEWEIFSHPAYIFKNEETLIDRLIEFDGNLLMIHYAYNNEYGLFCYQLLKSDRLQMKWLELDNLGNGSLLLDDASKMAIYVTTEKTSKLTNTIHLFDRCYYFRCLCLFDNAYLCPYTCPKIYDHEWNHDQVLKKIWIQPPL